MCHPWFFNFQSCNIWSILQNVVGGTQHITNLSYITLRTILSRPDTRKSRFLGYLKVSSRDGIQVDFKLMNMDRRVFICIGLNIVIMENRKMWTSLMSTGAPAPRALIRPGFTFTISLLFRFQGFMDSAHISINLPTLVTLTSSSPSTLASFSPSHLVPLWKSDHPPVSRDGGQEG